VSRYIKSRVGRCELARPRVNTIIVFFEVDTTRVGMPESFGSVDSAEEGLVRVLVYRSPVTGNADWTDGAPLLWLPSCARLVNGVVDGRFGEPIIPKAMGVKEWRGRRDSNSRPLP